MTKNMLSIESVRSWRNASGETL